MKEFEYVIKDELGIHARPAGMLVKEAAKFQSAIKIDKSGKNADAKRLFAIMSLAVKHGDTVKVSAEGTDEAAAADAMKAFFEANL